MVILTIYAEPGHAPNREDWSKASKYILVEIEEQWLVLNVESAKSQPLSGC